MTTVATNFSGGASILGDTSGNAVPAGYVGEFVKNTGLGSGAALNNNNWVDSRTITLSKGIWLVSASFQVSSISGLTAISSFQTALSQYSGNTTTDHDAGYNVKNIMMQGTTVTTAVVNEMAGFVFVVTDTLPTIYAKTYFSGTITSASTFANIKAIRIA